MKKALLVVVLLFGGVSIYYVGTLTGRNLNSSLTDTGSSPRFTFGNKLPLPSKEPVVLSVVSGTDTTKQLAKITLKTDTPIHALQTFITFDPNRVSVVKVTKPDHFKDTLKLEVNNDLGILSFAFGVGLGSDALDGDVEIATIEYKTKLFVPHSNAVFLVDPSRTILTASGNPVSYSISRRKL